MNTLLIRLQRALEGHYAVEEEIGRGGMAVVFLGRDLRHDRRVAIKAFEKYGGLASFGERFLLEIQVAAKLQHPNILPVFESGDGEGLIYYVMPYVAGGSVRERLEREGPLPVADAVRIAREVAEALDHAHRAGVVHRDIKPDNIMLADGVAVLADFGIAKALEQVGEGVTDTGLAIGTPAYMSPEQATAQSKLDGRSDQYALGCVLYELLAGTPPFAGQSSQAIMARHGSDAVPPLSTVRSVPAAVEHVIVRMLAKSPADRWPSAKAVAIELGAALATQRTGATGDGRFRSPALHFRRGAVAAIVALGLLVTVGSVYAWRQTQPPSDGGDGVSLAVLPFENLGDSTEAYFADGLTDEVRGKLADLPGFRVIARATASQYRKTPKPLRQVGDELGVRYLLTGTVRKISSGGQDRLVVNPELVEIGRSGSSFSKWHGRFDAHLIDVFQVQASIAAQVAEALRVVVASSTAPLLATAPTNNLAAYDEFLRGEQAYLGGSGPDAMLSALAHYERAVTLDSSFARAWGRVSQVSSSFFSFGSDSAAAERARVGAERGLLLAPRFAEAHLAMGSYQLLVRHDYRKAVDAFRAGLQLAPKHAELLGNLGFAEQALGNYDVAIDHMRRGLEIDPRSLLYVRRLTRALTWMHRFPEAEAMARRALEIKADDASAVQYAAHVRLAQGDLAGARAYFNAIPPTADSLKMIVYWTENPAICSWAIPENHRRLALRFPLSLYSNRATSRGLSLACVALGLGDTALGRRFAESAAQARLIDDGSMAWVLALRGDRAGAVRLVEKDFAGREGDFFRGPSDRHYLIQTLILAGAYEKALDHLEVLITLPYYITPEWLRIDPNFDPIRRHPRFQKLLTTR
jgi:serine/threonine-protein kinase